MIKKIQLATKELIKLFKQGFFNAQDYVFPHSISFIKVMYPDRSETKLANYVFVYGPIDHFNVVYYFSNTVVLLNAPRINSVTYPIRLLD